jgi:molybdenum cofactor synthesis domain-containing protein
MPSMIPLAEAQEFVLASCPPLPVVTRRLDEALGAALAADMVAGEAVPPFANTAMDGYAVRADDTCGASADNPVVLTVTGTLAAGAAPTRPVGPGEAIRIMTGAPIPNGADAIVMVEVTQAVGDQVRILASAATGDHVRPAGEDLAPGLPVFPSGTALGPGHLGVLASIGLDQVAVHRPATVGVLSTGDELVDDGSPLQPGQIRDSNRRTLLALARRAGCQVVDLGLARDNEEEITAALERGLAGCDAVLTSGGVSVGDFDYVKKVLDQLSDGAMRWMQVAIRPAKPFAFGVVRGTPVFGLPGNPVSSMVSFELFARPALRQMMGHRQLGRPQVQAVADEALARRSDGKILFVRVVAEPGTDGRFHVRSSGGQASNLLLAMANANALAVVPDGDGIPAGGDVRVMLLEAG